MREKLRILIADDSIIFRSQIRAALTSFDWIEVAFTAPNGRVALERLLLEPFDLLVLDIEMPELDGIQTLTEMARLGLKVPTLVFASCAGNGAEKTFEALRMGARDFIAKPAGDARQEGSVAPAERIRALLEPKLRMLFPKQFDAPVEARRTASTAKKETYPIVVLETFRPLILVIGSSTGGPNALERILTELRPPLNIPILIAQHMPPGFTAGLAERIGRLSGMPSQEGVEGELLGNRIYIAPGDFHMTVEKSKSGIVIKLDKGPLVNSVRPAVDPLFESAARVFGDRCLGLVLTGMGHDGRAGARAIKAAGGAVVIQDKQSSVVHGMPGAVMECGAYDRMGSLEEITSILKGALCA